MQFRYVPGVVLCKLSFHTDITDIIFLILLLIHLHSFLADIADIIFLTFFHLNLFSFQYRHNWHPFSHTVSLKLTVFIQTLLTSSFSHCFTQTYILFIQLLLTLSFSHGFTQTYFVSIQTLLTPESACYKDEDGKTVLMVAAEIGMLFTFHYLKCLIDQYTLFLSFQNWSIIMNCALNCYGWIRYNVHHFLCV